jgi:hypothetical protein
MRRSLKSVRSWRHKSVQTIKFYLELETTQASEIFTDIVRNRLEFRSNAS